MMMVPFKEYLAKANLTTGDLTSYHHITDGWWAGVSTAYYSGGYAQATDVLVYMDSSNC